MQISTFTAFLDAGVENSRRLVESDLSQLRTVRKVTKERGKAPILFDSS